jgi:hypothetical protein
MSHRNLQSIEAGSVLMDTTTFHCAFREKLSIGCITLGDLSLAQLVQAIILHEKIFIPRHLFQFDEVARQVIDILGEVAIPLSLDDLHRDAINSTIENILKSQESLWSTIRHSPVLVPLSTVDMERDYKEYEIRYFWDSMDYFGDMTRTYHGSSNSGISTSEYRDALAARSLYYYLVSRTFNVPYIPNAMRSIFFADITRSLGYCFMSPSHQITEALRDVVKGLNATINSAFGIDVLQFNQPLFLEIVLEGAKSSLDVLKNAILLRQESAIKDARRWCTQLTQAYLDNNINEIVKMLQNLESIKEKLKNDFKPLKKSISFSIGFPPSISMNLDEKLFGRSSSACFLYDLVELTLKVKSIDKFIPFDIKQTFSG